MSVVKNLSEARVLGAATAFLCHSHRDVDVVKGLVNLLSESGWRVYVDWADATMPDTPNRQTAERIQAKILETDWFLFLATANSMVSRWCPWEIGFADGRKRTERVLIVPTSDGMTTHGNEYLQLYRRIDMSSVNRLAVWEPGDTRAGTYLSAL